MTLRTVDLPARRFGPAHLPPVIVLHGLLGSSRNWQAIGKRMAERFRLCALDLRNHGDAPHADSMRFDEMAADLRAWMDANDMDAPHIVGHSLGGKVAMQFAIQNPTRLRSLTVIDISPRAYKPRWQKEFALLRALPIASLTSRREAEAFLETDIRDWAFRQFLLANLERKPEGGFRWRVNLPLLEANLPHFFAQVPADGCAWHGPTLFIRGALSRFLDPDELPWLRSFFPTARLLSIPEAGHNVHFDKPEAFIDALTRFLP